LVAAASWQPGCGWGRALKGAREKSWACRACRHVQLETLSPFFTLFMQLQE
jgi:hypothetical protein